MRNSLLLGLVFCAFVFVSCDKNRVYDQYKSIPSEWNKDSIVTFKFEAPDTLGNYNLFINLRNNSDYRYNNLFLIATIKYPHGKIEKDTLEYKMAEANGEFLGTGFSDLKENKLWYKGYDEPFTFSENGDYEISIQHAMRENGKVQGVLNLQGITDVGFRIENPQIK